MKRSYVAAVRQGRLGRVLAGIVAGGLLLAGCDAEGVSSPETLSAGDIRTFVTPELFAGLSQSGTFALAAPPAGTRVSPEGAKEMAVAFASTFGPSMRETLERQHGRSIDFERLRVGSPAYFAASPYEPLPQDAHPGLRNHYGPYYLLYLVSPDDAPALVVAISGSTEARVENGRVRLPLNYGADFYVEGVALGEGFAKPLSPEQAVRRVGEATGARVTAVPELLLADREYNPFHARWKVTVDHPISARGRSGGEARSVREVFVGLRGEFTVPSAMQPGEHSRANPGTGVTVRITTRPGRPVAFEPVTVANQ